MNIMQLIEPKVELINEENPFKKIELAGRTCYKSEKNITDESALKFYKNLVKHEHTAMLEHATFVFEVYTIQLYNKCNAQKYLNCTCSSIDERFSNEKSELPGTRLLVSGNLRAINESGIYELLYQLYQLNPDLVYYKGFDIRFCETCIGDCASLVNLNECQGLTNYEVLTHQYVTMRFTCDRGVTHEFVRHRPFSFAQESTRYVNYTKGDMSFVEPAEFNTWEPEKQTAFCKMLEDAERNYNVLMTQFNSSPQEARAVLPNAIKTELVVTGNSQEWAHFFDLRYRGTTGKPHPDIYRVAMLAHNIYPILGQNI